VESLTFVNSLYGKACCYEGTLLYLTISASHFPLAWLCYTHTHMPANHLVSKLLNGQHISHLCITKCMLKDTYVEYMVTDNYRQQFNMCKKFSSHTWCILAFKCLALNIGNFGRQGV